MFAPRLPPSLLPPQPFQFPKPLLVTPYGLAAPEDLRAMFVKVLLPQPQGDRMHPVGPGNLPDGLVSFQHFHNHLKFQLRRIPFTIFLRHGRASFFLRGAMAPLNSCLYSSPTRPTLLVLQVDRILGCISNHCLLGAHDASLLIQQEPKMAEGSTVP